MRRNALAAPIKEQFSPAPAESGDASVPILNIAKPADSSRRARLAQACRRRGVGIFFVRKIPETMQGDQSAGGIVRIGNASRQVRPSPAARLRLGVGMASLILPAANPFSQSLPLFPRQDQQAASSQGVDRKRRDPSAQVGINRPTAVFAGGVGDKVRRFQSDRMPGQSDRSHTHGHKTGQRRRF